MLSSGATAVTDVASTFKRLITVDLETWLEDYSISEIVGKECHRRTSIVGIRLNFTVEGQTEETFREQIPQASSGPQICLGERTIVLLTGRKRRVEQSRRYGRHISAARNDILRWMLEDQNPDARLHDYVRSVPALPMTSPGYQPRLRREHQIPYECVTILEDALSKDLQRLEIHVRTSNFT